MPSQITIQITKLNNEDESNNTETGGDNKLEDDNGGDSDSNDGNTGDNGSGDNKKIMTQKIIKLIIQEVTILIVQELVVINVITQYLGVAVQSVNGLSLSKNI